MRILCVATLAALIGLGTAGQVNASPITDTFDPADVFFNGQSSAVCHGNNTTDTVSGAVSGQCHSLDWTHVLPGFNPATDTLTSATLTLTLRNDGTSNDQSDKFDIVIDALSITDQSVALSIDFTSAAFATLLAQLANGSALTTFSVSDNGSHSFYFDKSVLNADFTTKDTAPLTPVPEPASLTLFGTGLFGAVAAYRRRRASKG
jgi:hypothetical protein